MRSALCLFCLSATLCFAPSAFAQESEGDYLTPRELLSTTRGYGLANAMTSAASGTTAIWHNPASITSATMYAADFNYAYNHAVSGHGTQANLVDMKSNPYVGMALGFLYQHVKNEEGDGHLIHFRFGFGVPLADNIISLGVSGMYTKAIINENHGVEFKNIKNHHGITPFRDFGQFSLDLGLIVRPVEWLAIGVSAQNLIVGDHADYVPRLIAAGISFGSLELGLNIMADISFNISAPKDHIVNTGSYGVGIEYVLKKFVPIRLGYRFEMKKHHVLSAGLGYRHAEGIFGLDLAYQHHFLNQSNESNDLLSGSINFYF